MKKMKKMKKMTTAFALGPILIGTFFPTIRIIAETTEEKNSATVNEQVKPLVNDATDIATGKFGSSQWRIDLEGTLHIGAGTFAYTDTFSPWETWASQIKKVIFEGKVVAGARSNYLFQNFTNVTLFENMYNFDMSNIRGASSIWENCSSLTSLDLSGTNAGKNGPLMNGGMFAGCTNLESLDLRSVKFDVNYFKAFQHDTKLSKITLDGSLNLVDYGSYPDIIDTEQYTGKWINIGNGTVDNPEGNSVIESSDLFGRNNNIIADTYVWQKKEAGGDVTAKYVDTDGNKISDDVIKSGNVGDAYTTEQKTIAGYTFKEVQGSATGTFTDQAQTVTYIYTKDPIAGGDVTAKYVDTDDNKISDDVIKSGNVGDAYTTEQKTIAGYTFKEVQGSATGTFTDQAQIVTYIYTKDPIAGGDVTAKYVDTDGNKISDDVVKSGNVGDAYTTEQKTIAGYIFKEVQGSATGTFTDQAQTVTYIYTKDPIAGGDITAKYVDTDGNKISDDVIKSGNVGDAYATEQKTIVGYTFKKVQGSATGNFTDQAQTVTYIYTKNNVTPSPKPNDHSDAPESSKSNGNKNDSTSENKNILPQTGDNEGLSMVGMISGLFLIFGTIVVILFKRKRQD
ncbi:MucBP domain-containing protein [Lactococcus lactis]|uniref:MucBP domain-containing protein n=3 Tax=Lactococcus lactis TaxID=1358 RepID=UPI0014562405|nr:MucBP domain-containing protein [Lactococcus lactis]NLS47986.1 LPXTG cell wall anchor domain-containing protein [Lactococcus lactis]